MLVHYKSEWYEELDAEGKRPEWEALNSEMTDDVENYLGYIKDGDEAKRDAYVSKFDASEQESIKQGLEQQRRDYERFPADYKDAPDKKLTPEQLNLLGKIKELEEKSELWEKTKEKATKMLWWDDVVEELAKQSQQTEQSDTETEKDKTEDSSKQQTETSSTPATLSQNGEVWFVNPLTLYNFVSWKSLINVEVFLTKYESEHKKFKKNENDIVPNFNQKSKDALCGIIERINLFYKKNDDFKPNIYYISYMLATARWEASWGNDFFCALEERSGGLGKEYFNKYDPVLASTEALRKNAKNNGNIVEGDGYKYRGRGLVHLTWKNNYKKASNYLGVDFTTDPDKAAELDFAVPIMIWGMMKGVFTGSKLPEYIYKNHIDYKTARKVINGSDSADSIASFANLFESILRQTSNLTEEF